MICKANSNLREKLYPMFKDMNDKIILSCLQGHMGTAWVNNHFNPTVAQLVVGDFIFYAGDPKSEATKELLLNITKDCLVVVNNDEWKKQVESIYKGNYKKFHRYAFKKDIEHLDRNHIKSFLTELPKGYEIKKIDETLANEPSLKEISEDFTSQFESIEDFINRGVGFCILHEGKVVCAASSYTIFNGGIEIEIGTNPNYRRKGLATIVASALILYCLDNGLYPSWDAANLNSVGLAEKLGYVLDKPYDTYFVKQKKN